MRCDRAAWPLIHAVNKAAWGRAAWPPLHFLRHSAARHGRSINILRMLLPLPLKLSRSRQRRICAGKQLYLEAATHLRWQAALRLRRIFAGKQLYRGCDSTSLASSSEAATQFAGKQLRGCDSTSLASSSAAATLRGQAPLRPRLIFADKHL